MDLFDEKKIKPMLIGKESAPFNDPNYLYELKFDGCRCLAYLNKETTELRNKRGVNLNAKFPELMEIHHQIKTKCILDGELYVYREGRTDFFELQRRTLTSDRFRIRILSNKYPATFTVFDILYIEDHSVMNQPLYQRKQLLKDVLDENERINRSRTISEKGVELFALTQQQALEGIVAKKRDSLYYPDTRTKEWIKCKNLLDDDFVIAGYIVKEKGIISLILGQYRQRKLIYKGHVTMGVTANQLMRYAKKTAQCPFEELPNNNEEAIWIKPFLVGTVKFMEYTSSGGLRQPIFKGFRDDKQPKDCKERNK